MRNVWRNRVQGFALDTRSHPIQVNQEEGGQNGAAFGSERSERQPVPHTTRDMCTTRFGGDIAQPRHTNISIEGHQTTLGGFAAFVWWCTYPSPFWTALRPVLQWFVPHYSLRIVLGCPWSLDASKGTLLASATLRPLLLSLRSINKQAGTLFDCLPTVGIMA